MSIEYLKDLTQEESQIKEQINVALDYAKKSRALQKEIMEIRQKKRVLIKRLYFSRKARQAELAEIANCTQSCVSRYISQG